MIGNDDERKERLKEKNKEEKYRWEITRKIYIRREKEKNKGDNDKR